MSGAIISYTEGGSGSLTAGGSTMENWGSTQVRKMPFRYNWIIKDFKSFYDKKSTLKSPEFSLTSETAKKVSMRLHVGPSIVTPSEHMTLYLHNCSNTLLWVKFKLAIINSIGEKRVQCSAADYRRIDPNNGCGRDKFIEWNKIFDSGLLLNDELEIICYGALVDGLSSPNGEIVQFQPIPMSPLATGVNNLLETGHFSDVTFVLGRKEFKAHKNVLSCRSVVFSTMFQSDMKEKQENKVEITDIDAEVFAELLEFIYTGRTNNVMRNAEKLLAAAEKYAIDDLKKTCEQEIASELSVRNAARILYLADLHSSESLKADTMEFICRNSRKVSETAEWKAMERSRPELLGEAFKALATYCEK